MTPAELQAALAGEYSLQRELGRGGMGVVYLAREVGEMTHSRRLGAERMPTPT